jgi:hypothetical protein
MQIEIKLKSGNYSIDPKSPIDISIPMNFNGSHPVAWGSPEASARTYTAEGFIGDTRRGGSCNVEEYRFIPHAQGTHTECVGHIANNKISIHNILREAFIPSTLITVKPEFAGELSDRYLPSNGT